ncbi:sulfatase [Galbibacter sp. BG1]|uniref:sulfatase family protein n=1 Tax=Galbibacter sp. BG1 TaxID=1170699 RepID=UPI001C707E98|nr:sulfatase-like hydrolase/transferase [Galbibacter sp. BG1]
MLSKDEIKEEIDSLGKSLDHAWLRWFDHAVGALVTKLKENGIYENTLIVITSDHGNYNLGKTTLYEGGVKVPLLTHWPKTIVKDPYDELLQDIDFMPTFLQLAGVDMDEVEYSMDGVSLKNALIGSKDSLHEYLFFALGFARGVTAKEWKYIAVRYDEQTQIKLKMEWSLKG